ncbi:hypothetical protein [Clostridium butyricum]|uniref:hypothetical protein n=1 Tax=Clostridium butyricum TaxID=1492 RepID=UPI00374EBC62
MIRELYTEDLDINLKYNIYLHCVQNDDVILNINVYDKSLQADLSNYTCRLKAFKSDHIPLIQNTNIDVTGNVVKIEASKQLTTTAGIVKAELQFTDKSTLKKKSTFFIEIKVEKSALNVDGALSTPMCTLLEEIDNKLDQIENIGQVLDEAKQVRDTLESDIVVGNTTNENIVQSISDADSKKREVEISISNASDKISEVEDSITNADNSRNALDRSKEVANETKIDLDNANVQAEKNIEELNKLGDVTDLAAKVQTNTENISKNNKSIEEVNSHLNDCVKNISANTSNITNHLADLVTDSDGVHGLKYESGIWTPVLVGQTTAGSNTYIVQDGNYIRVNKLVFINCRVLVATQDPAMDGNVRIAGLPFNAANTYARGGVSIGEISGVIISDSYKLITGEVENNSNTISFFINGNGVLQLQKYNLSGNFSINLSAVYQMA